MTSLEKDRAYLEAGVPELEHYLLTDEFVITSYSIHYTKLYEREYGIDHRGEQRWDSGHFRARVRG